MSDKEPHRIADPWQPPDSVPPGSPFPHRDWVVVVMIVTVAGFFIAGWWQGDWYTAGAVAGGFYMSAMLTIIALKD